MILLLLLTTVSALVVRDESKRMLDPVRSVVDNVCSDKVRTGTDIGEDLWVTYRMSIKFPVHNCDTRGWIFMPYSGGRHRIRYEVMATGIGRCTLQVLVMTESGYHLVGNGSGGDIKVVGDGYLDLKEMEELWISINYSVDAGHKVLYITNYTLILE